MSNYPCGMAGIRSHTVEIQCLEDNCLNLWEANATTDLGMTELDNEEDNQCPECGCCGLSVHGR